MKSLIQVVVLFTLMIMSQSCSNVKFGADGDSSTGKNCTGSNCPNGTYSWFEGGFNLCSKPCGGGNQTQTVECRRNADQVAVADSFCDAATRPTASRTCNVQTCASVYTWNTGTYGSCSLTCGGGQRTRTVVCQDQSGGTVADSNCPPPKPATSEACNTSACPPVSYSWNVTAGTCTKQCGGGTATDVVVCKRSDGATVADSYCDYAPKPPTTRTCNTEPCPIVYTYMWEPGQWSNCSQECGDGVQTRSVTCKRNDGVYVDSSYCTAATKPPTQQTCKKKDCPVGRKVTQTATVTPAFNAVDVILIFDDSSSMKNDQAKLASRMSGLLTDLDSLNIDYQICVTTTDVGYYKGSPVKWTGLNSFIMTKNSPNRNQVLINTVDALGAEWSSDEQGIKSLGMMIKDFKASGCIRNQATLSTIIISDENERSVGGNASWSSEQYQPLTIDNYPDTLISLVRTTYGDNKHFIWNSIIVKPGDTACEAQQDAQSTSPSFPGTLYAELSNKTGGHIGSICDNDYAQSLTYIKQRTVNNMPGLIMECTPIDVPVVTFDRPISSTITVVGNEIKFAPALSEGVKITATYTCPN